MSACALRWRESKADGFGIAELAEQEAIRLNLTLHLVPGSSSLTPSAPTAMSAYALYTVCPKWHPTPYLVHYFVQSRMGPIGNRVYLGHR